MKLLLDQNLSVALTLSLRDVFPVLNHVRLLGMECSSDNDIWLYARLNGYAIVTKDSDFYYRSQVDRSPAKVIWIRAGNGPTSQIEAMLRSRQEEIIAFLLETELTCLTLSLPKTSA